METCELLIIGGGPAGLTAGIYARRGEVETILVENGVLGGQVTLSPLIENYPGIPRISGPELAERMTSQASSLGLEIAYEEVRRIKRDGKRVHVTASENTYSAEAVIIASGAQPRRLGVEGEEELTGRGVSYCATCDGPLFKGRRVAVIGGGDSALTEALYLSKVAGRVYIIHRRDRFRAEKLTVRRVVENPKIEILWDSVVQRISGEGKVEEVIVKSTRGRKTSSLRVDGVFIYVGRNPNTGFAGMVARDDVGYILVNPLMEASVKGVYAAGDCTSPLWRQVAVAVGEGSKAALSAIRYLSRNDQTFKGG